MYKDIVIVSAVRTPFGRYCGALREYDYFDLGALPMREVLASRMEGLGIRAEFSTRIQAMHEQPREEMQNVHQE